MDKKLIFNRKYSAWDACDLKELGIWHGYAMNKERLFTELVL